MFRVYAENAMIEEGVRIFDHFLEKGSSIEERSCIVLSRSREERKAGNLIWMFSGAMNLFEEMRDKGIELDIHVYTSLISWNCRNGNLKRAFLLFDGLVGNGLSPSSHTYGELIDGVCRVGLTSEMLVKEMQKRGANSTQVVFTTLLNVYCRKGGIDDALRINDVMEKKGFQADAFTYNTV
ncbi:hypothetical protein CARUB_v10009946mg, partial [Capsella rubella]